MENIAIFIADSNGRFPVPAVKDGAVPMLVEHLIEKNNNENKVKITVVSYYSDIAYEKAKQYENINFLWVKIPKLISILDDMIFKIVKIKFKRKKTISYKTICSLLYYICYSSVLLRKLNFDKIILENNIPLAWIVRLSKYSGKYYYHLHNIPRIDGKCRKVFEKCDGYMCVSKFVMDNISSNESCIGKVSKEKIKVLYNCINTNLFNCIPIAEQRKKTLRDKYNISDEKKIIVFVGRLSEEKGPDKIIEALRYLDDNIHLLIVGSVMHGSNNKDRYQQYLYSLVEHYSSRITFTGYVKQEQVNEFYKIADVAVLPSMWEEPAGLTMIEAMACGTPLITCNSGGIPEYVNKYAVIIERDQNVQKNIAKSITDILNNNSIAKQKADDGAEYILNHYNLNKYYNNFIDMLKILQ